MTRLSVNINKIALLRNARGSNLPNLLQIAQDCERFGADGITIHPRPDQRHIRYQDVLDLKKIVSTELNIEGYPNETFLQLIETVKPQQCTLVPDPPQALTSTAGWNTLEHSHFLKTTIKRLHQAGCRVALFMENNLPQIKKAQQIGADRIELYTGPYAQQFDHNPHTAIAPYIQAAQYAQSLHLGVNAGHDLNLNNLEFFVLNLQNLLEVSIGHALICDAIYLGLENTIAIYKRKCKK